MRILNPQLQRDLEQGSPIKLHLGAGKTHREGHYSVDLVELSGVDVVADLNAPLDLLPDHSVSAIYTRHTLEHIANFMGLMSELNRICRPDAEIEIIVPHFSNPYFYSDPTHVRPFGLYTMHYFMDEAKQPGRKVPAFYTSTRFILKSTRIDFYRTSLLDRMVVPILRTLVNMNFATQEIYERRFCWVWPAWQIQYKLRALHATKTPSYNSA